MLFVHERMVSSIHLLLSESSSSSHSGGSVIVAVGFFVSQTMSHRMASWGAEPCWTEAVFVSWDLMVSVASTMREGSLEECFIAIV